MIFFQQERQVDAEIISCDGESWLAYDVSSDPLYGDLFRSVSFPLEQSPVTIDDLLVCDDGYAESQILSESLNFYQPKKYVIGTDVAFCQTNPATKPFLIANTGYKAPENLFIVALIPLFQNMPSDSVPATIVLTIDGLNAFMLGLHGNTSVETPAFDALAADSIAFEFAFAPSSDLRTTMTRILFSEDDQPVTAKIHCRSTFVSDCDIAIGVAESATFDSIIAIEHKSSPALTTGLADTCAADFFAAAIEAAQSLEDGDLLWLHFSGLSQIWDAPLAMRKQFQAMDDPEPYADHKPPNHAFDADQDDPDLLISVQQACFAQVAIIDRMLEIFLDDIAQHPQGQSAVLIVAGVRGYHLGEHGYVGIANDLYAQSLHVPLLVKLPEGAEAFQNRRSHALVQTKLIGDWIADPEKVKDHCAIISDTDSQPLFFTTDKSSAVQTAAWKFLRHVDSEGVISEQLFAKPDDRWEVNDVARRCPGIVEELEALLSETLN